MGFGVWGLGLEVWGLGFGVWGLGGFGFTKGMFKGRKTATPTKKYLWRYLVWDLGVRGFWFRVQVLGFRVYG